MAEEGFTCRSCGRHIAVAMSTCPWPDCRATIMVICAACRAYTDDQGEFCEQCGEPLVAATFEEVELPVGTQELLEQLVLDRERARLVASAVMARYSERFFGDHAPPEGVMADLLGLPLTSQSRAAAVLFAAIAYLVQGGYCHLERDAADGSEFLWVEVRDWEGQQDSLEAKMAALAWQKVPLAEAIRIMIATQTGFRLESRELDGSPAAGDLDSTLNRASSRLPNALNRLLKKLPGRQVRTRGIPSRPAAPTIVEYGWETVLPAHEERTAVDEARQVLGGFEEAEPQRAQYALDQICDILDWFENAELEQRAEYRKRYTAMPAAVEGETRPGRSDDGMLDELKVDEMANEGEATPPPPGSEEQQSDGNPL